MLPELLYEIYKYISPKEYLNIKEVESSTLKYLVDTFRGPLESKYIYINGSRCRSLENFDLGVRYIAIRDPTYWCEGCPTQLNYLLGLASHYGHLEVVKLLLNDGKTNPSTNYNYAIRWASNKGHRKVVELLLKDERVDPSTFDNEAIRYASNYGKSEIVKILLKDTRVNPSTKDNYAIRFASWNGHLEIVKLLLKDERVNPVSVSNQAIRWASINGHWEVVKLLLKDERVNSSLTNKEREIYLKPIRYH